jgi:hypothetical protein
MPARPPGSLARIAGQRRGGQIWKRNSGWHRRRDPRPVHRLREGDKRLVPRCPLHDDVWQDRHTWDEPGMTGQCGPLKGLTPVSPRTYQQSNDGLSLRICGEARIRGRVVLRQKKERCRSIAQVTQGTRYGTRRPLEQAEAAPRGKASRSPISCYLTVALPHHLVNSTVRLGLLSKPHMGASRRLPHAGRHGSGFGKKRAPEGAPSLR